MKVDEHDITAALGRADFGEAKRLAKWVLLLSCGHETYTRMNPKCGIGRGYCNRPGCSLSPEFATARIIVGTQRMSRRERRRMSA